MVIVITCTRCRRSPRSTPSQRWCNPCHADRQRERYAEGNPADLARGAAKHARAPGYYTERSRKWRGQNPARAAEHTARRRHRQGKSYPSEVTEQLLADPCTYCGEPSDTLDHIDALSRGGTNEWTNLTAACRRCNNAKYTKSLLVFLAGRR